MNLSKIHHIAIIVSDYEAAKDFYVNKLGFSVVRENYRSERKDWKLTFAAQKMRECGDALAEMVMEKLKAVAGKCLIECASVEFMSFIEDAYRCLKSR